MRAVGEEPARLTVLIYESYGFGQVAGEMRSVAYFLEFLNRRQFLPLLAAPFRSDPLDAVASAQDVECLIVPASPRLTRHGGRVLTDGLWQRGLTALAALKYSMALIRLMRARRVDVVCCWSLRAVLTVGVAALLARRPVLWVVNGELGNPILDRVGLFLASKVVFQCDVNKRDRYPILVRLFDRKIAVVRSGLDLARLPQVEPSRAITLRSELGIRNDWVNVIILGQLSPSKGTHHAIEALGRLPRSERKFLLCVVGDAWPGVHEGYREELRRRVNQYGLEDHVRFTGWRNDALEILALMDVLVHPSLSEGMPRAVLEGMALGKAVVATAVGCTRELVIDGENGFLVTSGDVDALTDRITRLLRSADLRARLGQAAQRAVFAGHDIQTHTRRFESFVTELTGRGPSA